MPADAWALPFAVGHRARSGTSNEGVERVSSNHDPITRGRMAGQERRIDDTMLIREAQQGNRAAFEELVQHYDQAVLRLALHLTGTEHDAQDVAQEAYLRALKYFDGFRGGDARSWVLAIVRNTCRTWYRSHSGEARAVEFDEELHSGAVEDEHPEAALIRAANRETVRRALQELPLEFREVIVLREIEGLSYKEIAEVAEIPVGTVMSRLARARHRLERALSTRTGGRG